MKIKVPCKILDKRIKNGWFFGRSYYMTIKLLTVEDGYPSSPLLKMRLGADRVREWPVRAENYYDLNVGEIILVSLRPSGDNDGVWVPVLT